MSSSGERPRTLLIAELGFSEEFIKYATKHKLISLDQVKVWDFHIGLRREPAKRRRLLRELKYVLWKMGDEAPYNFNTLVKPRDVFENQKKKIT